VSTRIVPGCVQFLGRKNVFTQPGSKPEMPPLARHVRSIPQSRHREAACLGPLRANCGPTHSANGRKPFACHDRKITTGVAGCGSTRIRCTVREPTRLAKPFTILTDESTGHRTFSKHVAHIASSGKRRMRSSSESIMESWRSPDRACGSRSVLSRPGGAAPLCYPTDVTPAMIESYRQKAASR
jgi:hypothetical protein